MHSQPLHIDFVVSRVPSNMLRLLRGAAAYARRRGNCIIKQWTPEQPNLRHSLHGDGVICEAAPATLLRALRRLRRPVVKVYDDVTVPRFPTVGLDEWEIGRLGARHLIECGFRHLGFYGCGLLWSTRREEGFEQEAGAAGANVTSTFHYRSPTYVPWARLEDLRFAAGWLRQLPRPTGIMACDDELAYRLAEACGRVPQAKLRIPEDIAIVGVDNNEVACEYGAVPLSSVDPDLEKAGYEAAALLDRLVRRQPAPTEVIRIAPHGVVVRRSTEVMAIGDEPIRRALAIIRQRATGGLRVHQLAGELGISRRLLERRFRAVLRRSPGEMIQRACIQSAQHLILSTDLSLTRIAQRCGFASSSSFSVAFRRQVGMPPREFRQRSRAVPVPQRHMALV